jgi:hypothetical protein
MNSHRFEEKTALWYYFPHKVPMEDKITIIEGPPPVFEPVQDGWALSLGEGPFLPLTLLTRLRAFNSPALVERCYRRWRQNETIHLHYRNDLGMEEQAPIVAARSMETNDGHVLLLWIQLDPQKVHLELDSGDDEADQE